MAEKSIKAKNVPLTSPTATTHRWPEYRSRAPEFYGFVAWTSTYLLFVIYILWAILPDEYIVWLGVTWYPNREWAILIPSWTVVVVLLTYFAYFAIALTGTPAFDQLDSITDEYATFPTVKKGQYNAYLASTQPGTVPQLYDIPIGMVNRVLYDNPPAIGDVPADGEVDRSPS